MDAKLMSKLQKILALTTSPAEGEAAAASAMLTRLCAQHNIEVADLEARGEAAAPGVTEAGLDLGKAAWRWKLDLGRFLARHLYCEALVTGMGRKGTEPLLFVGRPDNVESLRMLFSWLVGQVQEISRAERRAHHVRTGEHVDPLRWQLAFGIGCVERLSERLEERRRAEASKAGTALAVSHATEVSDYLERTRGFRRDGRDTAEAAARQAKAEAAQAKWEAEREDLRLSCVAAGSMERFYQRFPWERPETAEEMVARRAREAEAEAKARRREERNAQRRCGRERAERPESPAARHAREQRREAEDAGWRGGDKVNLEPFIEGPRSVDGTKRIGN